MDKSAPGYSHVEKGQKAAERAAELTRQLLVYSGHSKFETGPIYLNDVIEDNLHLFRLAIPAQVILRPQLSADLPPIRGDMGQIQQVIMNLIINGAEAIGDKAGAVTVRTTLQTLPEPRPTHSGHALTPGTYVVLTVEDDGCGMDEETQDKIFDPFFTTKFTGRGLGLAAVLGIVRGHDAGLQVKSAPEEGTEFCIYFPPTAVSPETPPAPPSAPETIAAAILIIDDEEPVRTAAADILSHHAYQILTASGGEEGIARCEAASPPVDLALLDLSMPGLSGEETFHRLRALRPSLPILFTSGYAPPETVNELQQETHVAFLQKPYTAAQLHRAVSQLLTRDRRRTNTSPG
jgi:CheY-like chemotaxis protein